MKKKNSRDMEQRSLMDNRTEEFEVKHIMKTLGFSATAVREAIRTVGRNPEKIEEFLRAKRMAD